MKKKASKPLYAGLPQVGIFAAVATELKARRGELRSIARATGLSYDTVLRVRDNLADVGICKVQALADHLGIEVFIKTPKRAAPPASGS